MGIHYDYKSTRGDKAMKKEAKRKARIEERKAKRTTNAPKVIKEQIDMAPKKTSTDFLGICIFSTRNYLAPKMVRQ